MEATLPAPLNLGQKSRACPYCAAWGHWLVRLLLESLEKVKSDLGVEHRDFIFVVFLRNDVFELMVSETPDKGKAAVVRIDWTDRVKLKQVIYLRLQASVVNKAKSFDDIWNRFFVDNVNGRDTFDYLVDHCLMRPRFLIAIIETAIANAINRGHEKVSEDDCIDAVKQHSNSILNDFGYEIRDVSGASEKVQRKRTSRCTHSIQLCTSH